MPRVLVTGSTRGIGKVIAERLRDDGWEVATHGTRVESGGDYAADLAQLNAAEKLLEDVLADGTLDALVNNAGIYDPFDYLQTDRFEAATERTLMVNFIAPATLTRRFALHAKVNGGGKVLNVASRVGFKAESGAAVYAASKAALINLTRSLAVELAPHNIQLFGIAPGWVDTAMAREGMADRLPEILASLPAGRMASPQDCASAASFLLSADATYLTGVVIDINGGSYFH